MFEIPPNILITLVGGLGFVCIFQTVLCLVAMNALKGASKEKAILNKELFGLVKKLEGLTSSRREQMIKHYDTMLENLAKRLPPTIAAHAGNMIVETEGRILQRLSELEPLLSQDDESRRKMEELVRSMERLEETLVAVTANTVTQVMGEGRRDLLALEDGLDFQVAA